MVLLSRSTVEVAGSLGIMAVAAVITFVSGLMIFVMIGGVLFVGAMALDGPRSVSQLGNGDPFYGWLLAAWSVAALLVAIHNAVSGLETMDDPTWDRLAKLIAFSALILATFPPVWFP